MLCFFYLGLLVYGFRHVDELVTHGGLTWLLPERFAESEIIPEAVTSILGILTTVNGHIIETTPSNVHAKPQECSSFPYSLCLTLMKDVETLVEVIAEQFYGDDNKWNFIAVTEATKVLARLALLRNSGYKMLLQGGETINDGKDPNDANQPQTNIQLSQKWQNGNFTLEGRALSALSRFGEDARMISNSTWVHSAEHHQRATVELPGNFKLSFLLFLSRIPFSSLRFGQFCDFRPKVCFSAFGSKRFKILPFSSGSLTPSIFLR
ncbi:putative peroxisome membrane protein, Pex16 [Helianthus annuus]|nr:putative peroxisome membrane protein, Pex16 [Helianthus annuus]